MKKALFLLLCIGAALFGEQGIVVPVCDRYMDFFWPSLAHLRFNVGSEMPIEVWHVGDELSEANKDKLRQFSGVVIKDVVDYVADKPLFYRGWQVKPKIMELSSFDEVLLMDADLFFYQDPKILFSHPKYLKSGAYFFRDRLLYRYSHLGKHVFASITYEGRRNFIRSKVPKASGYIPSEWLRYWDELLPTESYRIPADLQESGCVLIDKKRHRQGLLEIVRLNDNRAETYKYVYGDKETYWMGMEMADEPYSFNAELPMALVQLRTGRRNKHQIELVHFLDGKLFFHQKFPIPVTSSMRFEKQGFDIVRTLTAAEKTALLEANYIKELLVGPKRNP